MTPLDHSSRASIPNGARSDSGFRLARQIILMLLPLLTASAAAGQGVTGRVVEDGSSRPLAGVEIRLLDDSGEQVATALSNAEGRFSLKAERLGRYTLTAGSFGYRPRLLEAVDLRDSTLVPLTVRLEPRPIRLGTVTGRANRPGEHHEMSYAGFYIRHRESPSLGNNRVILRTDREFRAIISVRDLLYNFRPSSCPPVIFWNGFTIGRMPPDEYLDISSHMVEGIEYYRDLTSIPFAIRLDPAVAGSPVSRIRRCGVLVIWPRR
jgi:hypothetical protein